ESLQATGAAACAKHFACNNQETKRMTGDSRDVTNTRNRYGKAVVQLYIRPKESGVQRPIRKLKGFEKIALGPGETGTVSFALDRRAFAYYEPKRGDWTVESGEYLIEIGKSSREICLSCPVTVKGDAPAPFPVTRYTTIGQLMKHPKGPGVAAKFLPAGKAADGMANGAALQQMRMEIPLNALVSYGKISVEELDALREIVYMGIPPRTLYSFGEMNDGSLPVLAPTVQAMDPTYFTDFWTKPGYLGAVEGGSARRDRIHLRTRVTATGVLGKEREYSTIDGRNGVDTAWQKMLSDGSYAFMELEEVPTGENLYLKGCQILIESGAAAGNRLLLGRIEGKRVILGACYGMDDRDVLRVMEQLEPGDEVLLDNSDYIAILTYHRHQIPADRTFTAWDQYRDADGNPIYPQRAREISCDFIRGTGEIQTGNIQCPIIVMNNLMDTDFPWQADWYKRKIAETLGRETAERMCRLWYNDNCPHADEFQMGDELHVTSYLGMLNQALLYLARWVETEEAPPENSGYTAHGGQILQPPTAKERKGVQPVVTLLADESPRADIPAGQTVTFTAQIEGPERGGVCAKVEWSFEGETDFPVQSEIVELPPEDGVRRFTSTAAHRYDRPGTYFPVVRVESAPDVRDLYIRAKNICRARVVVSQ
ncbi:MAG: fibronectin type III-like domain-contianing protein, partial [Oscillibacter sp.]|nr:fibronectin type III-like domain-contianing protein [Oscillibacter sp.]